MSLWNDLAERNRAAVAKKAERVLDDTTYDRLRSPAALRRLVAFYVVTMTAMPVCWLMWGSLAGVLSILLCGAGLLLLRVAVRSQADLPDDVLDERMRTERDQVYVGAYRLVVTAVFIAANVALLSVTFRDEGATITLDVESMNAVYWPLLALVLGAPSMVMAMRTSTRPDD